MSPLEADKMAASLIPQIKEAAAALAEAEAKGFQQSLALVIKLGVLLNLAHETVYHGHWEAWFNAQGFDFSRRSATRYMRLAREREKLEDERNWPRVAKMAVEGELSIRAAEKLLEPELSQAEKDKAAAKRETDRVAAEANRNAEADTAKAAARSQDLAAVLSDKAPDELLLALGPDNDKKAELLKQQLKQLNPFSMIDLLVNVWEVDQLKRLGHEIAEHVKRKAVPEPVRRTVAA